MAASVKKNFLYNSAYQMLVALTPLITTPYLSRVIGAQGNGLFTFTQSITNYFVMVAMLGMSNYGVRAIAECGEKRELRSKTFWNAFGMNLLVGCVVLAAYVLYATTLGREHGLLWALWGMWVLGSVLDISWLPFGMQEFRLPTACNFVTRLASVVFIFTFVRSEVDVWAYVCAISGAFLANSIFVWFLHRRYVDWVAPTLADMRTHLLPCLTLFVPVIAVSLYTQLDKIMLGALSDFTQTGLYDYAEKISKMPMSVITALGAVVLPKMAAVISAGKIDEGKRLVRNTMWFMLACAGALAFGIAAVAPEFCPVFLGPGYEACVELMRLLCAIVPLICASNVLGVQYLLPTHRDRLFTTSVLAGALVNVAINLCAIPVAGAVGAAIATVLAEIAVVLVQGWAVHKELELRAYVADSMPFAAIGAAMFCVIRLLARVLGAGAQSAAGLMLEVACGAIFYLLASYIWCYLTKNRQLKELLPRLARW